MPSYNTTAQTKVSFANLAPCIEDSRQTLLAKAVNKVTTNTGAAFSGDQTTATLSESQAAVEDFEVDLLRKLLAAL